MKKIDLTSYIKNEEPKEKTPHTPEQKRRQAEIYLGFVACGNLMFDWFDELDELSDQIGMKPSSEMNQGRKGIEVFTHEFTRIFSEIIESNKNTSITDIQNRIEYTIKKEVKQVSKNVKKQ